MSRLTCHRIDENGQPGNTVVFGLDHAVGWFCQEFDENDDLVVDLDTMFNKLSRGGLLEFLQGTSATEEARGRITLDLDPGTI